MNNNHLVDLIAAYKLSFMLKSPQNRQVLDAMRRVDRKRFIPRLRDVLATVEDMPFVKRALEEKYGLSISDEVYFEFPDNVIYQDKPIPIGYNQTCSQPSVVAFMADLLRAKAGTNILEIGAGCGYNAAILAELVGSEGYVTSVERINGLARLAQRNLEAFFGSNYQERVSVVLTDGSTGWAEKAPYDAIILTAGVQPRLFDLATLIQQVPTGVLLYPEFMGPITRETYQKGNLETRETFGSFGFVPLQKGVM